NAKLGKAFEQTHATSVRPTRDDLVEGALAQGDAHLHVLRLHELPHVEGKVVAMQLLLVRPLVAFDDAAAVREKVRDDVRPIDARVFGLYVENGALVLDVVVEADLSAVERRAPVLLLELLESLFRVLRDERIEQRVVAL